MFVVDLLDEAFGFHEGVLTFGRIETVESKKHVFASNLLILFNLFDLSFLFETFHVILLQPYC